MGLVSKAFDQRRSLVFSLFVGTGGVLHHIVLSYFEWGRIWWYTVLDIVLVGFVWWFVVAGFLWVCVSIAFYSYLASKHVRFTPNIVSHTRMCGLESFETLSVIPAVAWATVVVFGILSTFDPYVLKFFPQLVLVYLALEFLIVASSMTAIFSLPVFGYRAIILPLKRSFLMRLNQLISSLTKAEDLASLSIDDKSALKHVYLWELLTEIESVKEWPLSMGSSVRFLLSYMIPATIYLGRLILLFSFKIQIPA